MIYLSADLHLSHLNVISHCDRPFWKPNPDYGKIRDDGTITQTKFLPDVHEMNKVLIQNINDIVGLNDTLWILGDFTFRGKVADFYRPMINCRNVNLILGNHDDHNLSKYKTFSSVQHYKELKYNKRHIVMCHYPMISWRGSGRGSIMCYGHCHGNLQYKKGRMIDVGVDCWDFKPISLDFIIEKMEKVDINFVDHHGGKPPHEEEKNESNLSESIREG